MYEFITHTWNPIKGRCYHDCAYCYMKSLVANPKPIHLDESELKGIFQRDQFSFIGSSSDDFASDVPSEWINKVLVFCVQVTFHQTEGQRTRFLIQTKNPERILEFIEHPLFKAQNVVVCTTIETNRHYPEIMNGTDEFGIRRESDAGTWDNYYIYTFDSGTWKYLIEPIWTYSDHFYTDLSNGNDVVERTNKSGYLRARFSDPRNDGFCIVVTLLHITLKRIHDNTCCIGD